MAHKVMDGGTTYEISGGKVMDGGTVYEVSKGKVMDGGTVYEISFVGGPYTITITGSGEASYAWVTIGEQRYRIGQTVEYPPGTQLTCFANDYSANYCEIRVNGATVKSGVSAMYTHTLKSNLLITISTTYRGTIMELVET
jgi:hypothetical protein